MYPPFASRPNTARRSIAGEVGELVESTHAFASVLREPNVA